METRMRAALLFAVFVGLLFQPACGGGGDGGPPYIAGLWHGLWFSDVYDEDGEIDANFVQDFETVGGTLNLLSSPCFSEKGNVIGFVSEVERQFFGRVDFPNEGRVEFDGTVHRDGRGISGTYEVVSGDCTGDFGDFLLSRYG